MGEGMKLRVDNVKDKSLILMSRNIFVGVVKSVKGLFEE